MDNDDNSMDFNPFEEAADEAKEQHQKAQQLQNEVDHIDKLMYDLVMKQKKAMDFLFTKYVIDTNIAAPGDDLLTIGINQGKVELLKWIFARAEISQTRAVAQQQTKKDLS